MGGGSSDGDGDLAQRRPPCPAPAGLWPNAHPAAAAAAGDGLWVEWQAIRGSLHGPSGAWAQPGPVPTPPCGPLADAGGGGAWASGPGAAVAAGGGASWGACPPTDGSAVPCTVRACSCCGKPQPHGAGGASSCRGLAEAAQLFDANG